MSMGEPKTPQAPDKVPEDHTDVPRVKEIGGKPGPEPTRYGDWEIGGKCVDF